jgi:hypothetical protein
MRATILAITLYVGSFGGAPAGEAGNRYSCEYYKGKYRSSGMGDAAAR